MGASAERTASSPDHYKRSNFIPQLRVERKCSVCPGINKSAYCGCEKGTILLELQTYCYQGGILDSVIKYKT